MPDMDGQILQLLERDARVSNSEVARALRVSEAFVRSRIKKLVESGTINLGLIVDFSVLDITILANARLRFEVSQLNKALARLTALQGTSLVLSTTGHFNAFCILVARDHSDLARMVRQEIRTIPGYLDMELAVIDEAFKYDPRQLPVIGGAL